MEAVSSQSDSASLKTVETLKLKIENTKKDRDEKIEWMTSHNSDFYPFYYFKAEKFADCCVKKNDPEASDSDKRILAAVSSAKKNLKTESNIGLPIVIIMFLCLLVLSKITQKNSFPKLYFLYFNFFCLLRAVNKTNNG